MGGSDDIEALGPKGSSITMREFVSPSNGSAYEDALPRRKPSLPPPVSVNPFKHPKLWVKQELYSWRFYTVLYASLAVAVWIWNLFALIGVIAVHGVDDNGRVTLLTGGCSQIIKTNRYIHWFISVFGTGFLSASAYVMVSLL